MKHLFDKLAFILFCWVCAFALPSVLQAPLIAGILILPVFRFEAFVGPSWRRRYVRFLLSSVILASLIVLLNGLFIRHGSVIVSAGPFVLFEDGVAFGIRVAVRLILLTSSVLVVAATTPIRVFADAMRHASIPAVIPAILLLAIDLVELLPSRIERVFIAQESRGAPVRSNVLARTRSLLAVAGPLMISSIVESVDRSHALAARGFQAERRKSASYAPSLTMIGWSLLACAAGILVWSLWHFRLS
jgi:energy-coupling factor transport system permease protein